MRAMLIHVDTSADYMTLREQRKPENRPFKQLHDWMQENYTKVWYCMPECGACIPHWGTQFEVLEPLEYPFSLHETKVLAPSRYEVIGAGGGSTSHQIRLRNLETGEEFYLNYAYDAQSHIDWRGTREIAAPKY